MYITVHVQWGTVSLTNPVPQPTELLLLHHLAVARKPWNASRASGEVRVEEPLLIYSKCTTLASWKDLPLLFSKANLDSPGGSRKCCAQELASGRPGKDHSCNLEPAEKIPHQTLQANISAEFRRCLVSTGTRRKQPMKKVLCITEREFVSLPTSMVFI